MKAEMRSKAALWAENLKDPAAYALGIAFLEMVAKHESTGDALKSVTGMSSSVVIELQMLIKCISDDRIEIQNLMVLLGAWLGRRRSVQ